MFRNGNTVYIRWLLGVILAIGVAVLISDYIIRDYNINACAHGNDRAKAIVESFQADRKARSRDAQFAMTTEEKANDYYLASVFDRDASRVAGTLLDCAAVYPAPIPFIR